MIHAPLWEATSAVKRKRKKKKVDRVKWGGGPVDVTSDLKWPVSVYSHCSQSSPHHNVSRWKLCKKPQIVELLLLLGLVKSDAAYTSVGSLTLPGVLRLSPDSLNMW